MPVILSISVMEVACGEYGDMVPRLVVAVRSSRCEQFQNFRKMTNCEKDIIEMSRIAAMSVLARKRAEDGNPLEMHEMMLKVEEDAGTAGNDLEKSPNSGVPSKDSKKAACSGKAVEKQVKSFIFLDWFYIISVVSLSELVLSEMVFFALNS